MRIAVLGLGFMGSTHLKALQSLPDVEIGALFSSDEGKLAGDLTAIQGNLGGPGGQFDFGRVQKYREIEPLLADPSIDAVDICLPTDLHAAVAIEALRAGKHVLVEKPMALDAASAQRMVEEARRNQRVLMTAHVLRFLPMYRVLRDRLASGELGSARWALFRRRCAAPAWSRWLGDANRSGGGVFDLLIHDVDICLQLFGLPQTVSATGYEALDAGIDLIMAELHYPGQGTAFISGGWHHPKTYPFSMEYTVVADGGTFEYNSASGPPTLYLANGDREVLESEESNGYAAELQYFVDCCRTGCSPGLCAPEESAAAVALTRLLLDARNRNGEIIACNLFTTSKSA
jgi:predicted dehydrogenase